MFKELCEYFADCTKEMFTFFQKTGHFSEGLVLVKKIC